MLARVRAHRRDNPESGVTLIELMMAIAILGLIMAPLTAALIVFLRTNNKASVQLSESNGADLTSVYFAPDVRNAVGVSPASGTDCAGGSGELVRLDEGSNVSISYSVRNNQLFRVRCVSGVGGPSPSHALASGVVASPAPAAACSPNPSCAAWTSVTLTYTGPNGGAFTIQATKRT